MASPLKYVLLYQNCLIVKGAQNNIICDLQLERYINIPDNYVEILELLSKKKLNELKEDYDKKSWENILLFLYYLESKNYLFFSSTLDNWPKLNLSWDSPSKITNSIIDLDNSSIFFKISKSIYKELVSLGCRHIQLRIFEPITLKKLSTELNKIESSNIFSVEVLVRYSSEMELQNLKLICQTNMKVNFVLFNCKLNPKLETPKIKFVQSNILNEKCCGKVSMSLFEINLEKFTESLNKNSCLNKKLSIDVNGNIKNCPSMPRSFGNLTNTTLQEALDNPDFKKYWNITKDQITVCKDCEFRYICTDCRAYLENPKDQYSRPLKCGYDPYTNQWEEWSTNPLKQKAIEYYGMQDLVKKNA
ncbi:grasp-with-spasm system SPASM domain peptide maturase [Muricauda sp. NFXS6]|uniref:grasp-with-spasm system SPASM domain peptide maturase n=1 Tax=Allomuricauda sp. NFXS6 TaxID=2819094 RepID=UPI0032DE69E2